MKKLILILTLALLGFGCFAQLPPILRNSATTNTESKIVTQSGLAAGSYPINGMLATNLPFSYIDPAVTATTRLPGRANHANLDRLWSFQNTLEYSNRPVRILVVTDELGFPGDETFVTNLRRMFPTEGSMANGVGFSGGLSYTRSNAFASGSTTAANVITNYINTDTRYWYTNGAAANCQRYPVGSSDTNFLMDTISICYQTAPYAGTFQIQTNFNGTWGNLTTIDTITAETNVAYTNIVLPVLTNRTFRLLSLTGTNEFLGIGCWNSTTNDLLWGKFYINAGPTLETVATARTNCSWPWWKFLNPDLILILDSGFLKVDGVDFRARMSNTVAKLELMWSNTCPLADVVHFGWVQTYGDNTTEYNAELYDQCIRWKRGFFDTAYYARLGDMTNAAYGMTNRLLFQTDLVHPHGNGLGAAYLNNALWKELFQPGTIVNPLYANPRLRGDGAKFLQGSLGNIQNTTNLGTMFGLSGGASTASIVMDNDILGRDLWGRNLVVTGAVGEVTWRMQNDNSRTIRLSGKGARVMGLTEASTDVYFAVTNNAGAISYGWSMNSYPAGYSVQMGTLANRYRLYTSTTLMGMTNVTANRTLDADDHTIVFNGTTLTATLPTAVGALGKSFVVKNLNASALTVTRTSSQTIDGVAADDSITVGLAITYTSDGTGWVRTARY